MNCSIMHVMPTDVADPWPHRQVSMESTRMREVGDPKAQASDLDVIFVRGNPRRLAESLAEVFPICARAGVERSVVPEDLRGLPVAMADQEVIIVQCCNAPRGLIWIA